MGGTQNDGEIVESTTFTDLTSDAFYAITTTGDLKLMVNRGGQGSNYNTTGSDGAYTPPDNSGGGGAA